MLKNRNWREADQLVIYKQDREVELGSTEKQLQLSQSRELKLRILSPGTRQIFAPFYRTRPSLLNTHPAVVADRTRLS